MRVQWSVGTHGKQTEYYWDCFGTCKLSSVTFYCKPKSPSQRVSDKAMFTSRLLHPFWPLVCSCINSSVHPIWICPEDRVCRRADASADIFRRFVDLGSGRGMAVRSSGSSIGSQGTLNLLIMWKYPTLSISYLSKKKWISKNCPSMRRSKSKNLPINENIKNQQIYIYIYISFPTIDGQNPAPLGHVCQNPVMNGIQRDFHCGVSPKNWPFNSK